MNELYIDEDGFIYSLQYNLQLMNYNIFFSTVFQSFLRYLIIGLCICMPTNLFRTTYGSCLKNRVKLRCLEAVRVGRAGDILRRNAEKILKIA